MVPSAAWPIDWGDAPTWVIAVATLAAAGLTGYIASRANRIQDSANATAKDVERVARRSLDRELEDEARMVAWWVEDVVHQDPRVEGGEFRLFEDRDEGELYGYLEYADEEGGYVRIMVSNANPVTPVSEVVLVVPENNTPVSALSRGTHRIGIVRPGRQYVVLVAHDMGWTPTSATSRDALIRRNGYALWLQFTDSRGTRWRRYANGRLERLAHETS